MSGTTKEGERVAFVSEELFMDLIDAVMKRDGSDLTVEWGTKKFTSVVYYEPTIYEHTDEEADADPG